MSPMQRQSRVHGVLSPDGDIHGEVPPTHRAPATPQPSLLIRSWNCLFRSYCGARGCQMLARYHISVTLRMGCCVLKKEESSETGGNDVLGGIGGLCHTMKDPVRGRHWGLERGCIQILRFLLVLGPWTQAFPVPQTMETGIFSPKLLPNLSPWGVPPVLSCPPPQHTPCIRWHEMALCLYRIFAFLWHTQIVQTKQSESSGASLKVSTHCGRLRRELSSPTRLPRP